MARESKFAPRKRTAKQLSTNPLTIRTRKREERLTGLDAAYLRLRRNAAQARSRARQKFQKSSEYEFLTTDEREAKISAVEEEINNKRDIAMAEAAREFEGEDSEIQEESMYSGSEDEDSDYDDEEAVESECDDDEDETNVDEEYMEDRKKALGEILEKSIKKWTTHIKKLESRADPMEEFNEPADALSDLSD